MVEELPGAQEGGGVVLGLILQFESYVVNAGRGAVVLGPVLGSAVDSALEVRLVGADEADELVFRSIGRLRRRRWPRRVQVWPDRRGNRIVVLSEVLPIQFPRPCLVVFEAQELGSMLLKRRWHRTFKVRGPLVLLAMIASACVRRKR